jgi:hypothetical protein
VSRKFCEAEVAKEMRLIPEALKRDFISPIVKAFVRSCIMMIEGMTSSSNLVASWFSFSQVLSFFCLPQLGFLLDNLDTKFLKM